MDTIENTYTKAFILERFDSLEHAIKFYSNNVIDIEERINALKVEISPIKVNYSIEIEELTKQFLHDIKQVLNKKIDRQNEIIKHLRTLN